MTELPDIKASNSRRLALNNTDELPAFPEGWFLVASRETILRETLIEKTWMGREIIAWSDGNGHICVADAFCPHLGSHLGPTVGGKVRDGCLVCPFHGFEFDATGQCVATPNAPAPRAARLGVLETREILGMVFAWWGAKGRPPQWDLPDEPPTAEWSRLRSTRLRFRGHPQETTENSVDVEHLGYTHGYHDVEPTGSLSIDGAYLKSCFDFTNVQKIAGLFKVVSEISAVAHVHGLGYSFVEFHEKKIGLDARLWVLSTPIDGTFIDVVLVSQVREIHNPGRFIVGLGFLPMRLRHRLMNPFFLRQEKRYVLQDVVIWERKRFRSHPRLCRADGPLGKYRRYCRQFYPELEPEKPGAGKVKSNRK